MEATLSHNDSMQPTLSSVVISRDEERNIEECLETLQFVDERIVVDSGSQDRTVELARPLAHRVEIRQWEGFGVQRNFALSLATADWVLVVDADERVTPELAREIKHVLDQPEARELDYFQVRRVTRFLGRTMDHCWPDDWTIRLFRRGKGHYDRRAVHERFVLDDARAGGRLAHVLDHHSYRDLSQYVSKLDLYTRLWAEDATPEKEFRLWRLVGSPLWAFLRMYVLRRGFLDGVEGLILSIGTAYYHFMKYARRWERDCRPCQRDA